jgi:hypothetical protein
MSTHVQWNSLSNIRKIHQNKFTEYMKENQINYNYVSRSEEELLKLAIDCSTNEWLPINHMVAIERNCKNWIYALHVRERPFNLKGGGMFLKKIF